VLGQAFQDVALKILPENVYNMDETGVMLSKLGSVKVLVGYRVKLETFRAGYYCGQL
jgi:hypothetical protein